MRLAMKIEARYYSNFLLANAQCSGRPDVDSDQSLRRIRQMVKASLVSQKNSTLNKQAASVFCEMAKEAMDLASLLTADVQIEIDRRGMGKIHFEMQDFYDSLSAPTKIKYLFLRLYENAAEVYVAPIGQGLVMEFTFPLYHKQA